MGGCLTGAETLLGCFVGERFVKAPLKDEKTIQYNTIYVYVLAHSVHTVHIWRRVVNWKLSDGIPGGRTASHDFIRQSPGWPYQSSDIISDKQTIQQYFSSISELFFLQTAIRRMQIREQVIYK
jgi:hypothetical protein